MSDARTVPLALAERLRLRGRLAKAFWRARGQHRLLLFVPVGLFLVAFFLVPAVMLFRISLADNPGGSGYGEGTLFYRPGTWTAANYVRFFTDDYFTQIAIFTLELGLATAVVTTALAYLVAYRIYRAGALKKSALLMVVIFPKFTNPLVLMYGFLLVFGANGLINKVFLASGMVSTPVPMVYNLFSVLLGEMVLVLPYCVLSIAAVLHTIDGSLREAAAGLGATPGRVFLEITLPLSLQGVWVSLLLSFIWGIGAFASPYVLGNPDLYTLAIEVERQANHRLNWAMGAAVAFVLIAMILVPVLAFIRIQRDRPVQADS